MARPLPRRQPWTARGSKEGHGVNSPNILPGAKPRHHSNQEVVSPRRHGNREAAGPAAEDEMRAFSRAADSSRGGGRRPTPGVRPTPRHTGR